MMPLTHGARRLLKLLQMRSGQWVSCVEMQALGMRNWRQRIRDLRLAGYRIDNRREYVGRRHDSCYRLVEGDSHAAGKPGTVSRTRRGASPAPGAGGAAEAPAGAA